MSSQRQSNRNDDEPSPDRFSRRGWRAVEIPHYVSNRKSAKLDEDTKSAMNRDYARERQETYPDTYRKKYPSTSSRISHAQYKVYEVDARAQKEQYDNEKVYFRSRSNTLHSPRVQESDVDYNQLKDLEPQYHARLVEPAGDVASIARRHADARADFLEIHPYAYRTRDQRDQHVGYMEDAYTRENTFHRLSGRHAELSKSGPGGHRVQGTRFASDSADYGLDYSDDRYSDDEDRRSRPRSRHSSGAELREIRPSGC